MRLIFMGTPDFAANILSSLYGAGHEILCAVSQPDKPVGRHAGLKPTEVKKTAMELGIPVMQPEKASDPAFIERVRKLSPDAIIVAAYGKILKKELLSIPRYGCINVHASLLPRWRGAAPIQWAVIEGDKETGVTAMLMDEGLDTGAVLLKKSIAIGEEETSGTLFEKLEGLGGELITETLDKLEKGLITPVPQPEEGMTYAPMLKKEMGNIDWNQDALKNERLVRGLAPWPGTFTYSRGKLIKIISAAVPKDAPPLPQNEPPGTVILREGRMYAACGSGFLEILELKPEGKRQMPAAEFARGNSVNRFSCSR